MKNKKILLLGLMVLINISASAQFTKSVVVELWPNGAPNDNGITTPEKKTQYAVMNVSKASMTIYPSSKPNSKAVIMCPGGGYGSECDSYEGHYFADWFHALDITYIVIRYRLPNMHNEIPLTDVHRAIEIVRERAKEWNVNSNAVGIMGCSAGGHLAATGANFFTETNRPDFQILLYPVITMDIQYTHRGTREHLIGENPSNEIIKKYSMELQVSDKTPRAFIVLASDDKTVPPINSINYYMALLNHKVSVTMFIYPTGGHGFGFLDKFIYKRQWTGELEKWLSTF